MKIGDISYSNLETWKYGPKSGVLGLSGRVDSTVTNRCLITSGTHATLAGPSELFINDGEVSVHIT